MKSPAAGLAAMWLFTLPVVADNAVDVFPAGALLPDDARVVAFYHGQCENFARERRLTGDAKDRYIESCKANGPAIWPVGADPSSGGGE